MRKRALKKRREELRELLADRREALGELVLGMHVQGVWDDGLLARGAAEVREVEDGLNELEDDGGTPEERQEAPDAEVPPATREPVTEAAEEEPEAEEAGAKDRGRRWRRKPKKGDDESASLAEPDRSSTTEAGPHPEFETAEHTTEHRLPPAPVGEPVTESAAGETPPEPPKEPVTEGAAEDAGEAEPVSPKEPTTEPARHETAAGTPSGKAAGEKRSEPPAEAAGESAPKKPPAPVAGPGSGPPGKAVAQSTTPGKAAAPGSSPLDALEARLEREEREARTGVEAAKASVEAESGTEVASLIETLKKDREGLEQALGAASVRLADADRRAGEAAEKATRLEVENREAAARWVREQAAEIEADAAVAAELSEAPRATPTGDPDRLRELEGEVSSLRSQLDDERREKTRAIEAAEARLREIETRATEVEAEAGRAASGPDAAELREAAVTWLRGQIVALRREIEAGGGRDGGDS